MCGIAGFIDYTKKSDRLTLMKMTDVLHHRGPDDSGYSFYNKENFNIGLGHRRLSILDLSKYGHQPMKYKNLEIVYNGEVYNFKKIREELEKYGYRFNSNTDTEVILKSYDKWGIDAVHKFNGMFSMAIYDDDKEELTLIRDRAGVKPLYYYYKDGLLMFASEMKSFHQNPYFKKNINVNSLSLFLQFGYILEPNSIFNDAYKLQAGHYLVFNLKSSKIKIFKYWDVLDFYEKPKLKISTQDALEETENIFKSAFKYRMVSDVPVGLFLSGGYDSSTVAAILQSNMTKKLKTFTIGFYEDKYNEANFARKVAKYLGTEHTEHYCTQKDALNIIPKLPEIYDEPFGDSSAIPTALVSSLAKRKVKVSLSADGGDEIFGGYNKYSLILKLHKTLNKIPFKKELFVVLNILNPKIIPFSGKVYNIESRYEKIKNMLISGDPAEYLKSISEHITFKKAQKLIKEVTIPLETNFSTKVKGSILDQIMAIDFKTYLVDDILTKVDRATMSVSLEGREPLLDYRIIEFVAQLPDNLKIRNGEKKWILKQILHKYIPKEIMDRPKKGFSIPIYEWLKGDLKELLLTYLNEERLNNNGIFNSKEVLKYRDRFLNGKRENIQKLWFMLVFEMWYEKWI